MFNLMQTQTSSTSSTSIVTPQQMNSSSSNASSTSTNMHKLPTFLSNHTNPYNLNYHFNMASFNSQQKPQIFLSNQQQQQYQFQNSVYQNMPALAPQWCNANVVNEMLSSSPTISINPIIATASATNAAANTTPNQSSSVQRIILNENSDDHFNRHIENLNKNDDDNTSLICEEQEELNEAKLTKLINLNKKKSILNEEKKTVSLEDNSSKLPDEENVNHLLSKSDRQEEDNDEDYFCVPNDEQPKVFQDEDGDLQATNLLLDKSLTNSELGNIDSVKTTSSIEIRQVFAASTSKILTLKSSSSVLESTATNSTAINTTSINTASNLNNIVNSLAETTGTCSALDSVMPTPLAYSRSSSFTSLNSFDVKSIHSEVASEYSHYPSNLKSPPAFKNKKKLDKINSDVDDEDDDTEEEETSTAQKNIKCNYRSDGNETYELEDDYDFDKLMPESPAAPADSSFVMQQRIKHKQLQLHYREKAAANMLMPNHATANLSNNFLEIKSSSENIVTKQEGEKQQVNAKSMWQTQQSAATSTSLILSNSVNGDINAIMSKLSTSNGKIAPQNSGFNANNCYASILCNNNSSVTSFNNNNCNTPPVKLPSTPKFAQHITAPTPSLLLNTLPNTTLSQPTVTNNPPMSVTYAFMKNSIANRANLLPISVPPSSAVSSPAPSNPTPVLQQSSTNAASTTATGLNPQPKFLMSSNHHYPIFNTVPIVQPASTITSNSSNNITSTNNVNSIVKLSPHSSTSSASCSSSVVSNTNKSPQTILDELPNVYSIETRLNHNRYVVPRHNANSPPTSPQESVCSRMSDTSIPSLIRQDIVVNRNKLQAILKNTQQQHQSSSYVNNANTNDFKALFSKLNNKPQTHNLQQQQYSNIQQYQSQAYTSSSQNQKLSPTYKFNYQTQNFNYESSNANINENEDRKEQTTCSNNLYDYEPKQFLTEDSNFETVSSNIIAKPNIALSEFASFQNPISNFNLSNNHMNKPAFLNSYKFMSNTTTKDEIVTNNNNNSATNSILYSPKVFQNEGTNSRYSSASSLDHEENLSNPINNYQNNNEEDEEDQANLTGNNLNLTTKPMNTPAGFGSMSGASLIDVGDENDDSEDSNRNSSESQKKSITSTDLQNEKDNSFTANKLELGILDLENFISELYSSAPEPEINNEPLAIDSNNKKKLFKRASLQSIDSTSSSSLSVSSLTMASDLNLNTKSNSILSSNSSNISNPNLRHQSQKRLSISHDRTGAVIINNLSNEKAKNVAPPPKTNTTISTLVKTATVPNSLCTLRQNQTKFTKKTSDTNTDKASVVKQKPSLPSTNVTTGATFNQQTKQTVNQSKTLSSQQNSTNINGPVVNMTKSSQLRASSKQTTTLNNKLQQKKPTNNLSSISSVSSINHSSTLTSNISSLQTSQIAPKTQQTALQSRLAADSLRRKSFGLTTTNSKLSTATTNNVSSSSLKKTNLPTSTTASRQNAAFIPKSASKMVSSTTATSTNNNISSSINSSKNSNPNNKQSNVNPKASINLANQKNFSNAFK